MQIIGLAEIEGIVVAICESSSGALYIATGNGKSTLFTNELEKVTCRISWNYGKADFIASRHNEKSEYIKLYI